MTQKVARPLAVATAVAVVTAGAFAGAVAVPSPASAHWSCGRAAPSDRDTSGDHYAYFDAVARVGSSLRCAVNATDIVHYSLDYHCWALDINLSDTWTYVVTVGENKRGWVNDEDLLDRGSRVRCSGETFSAAAPADIDLEATERAQEKPVPARR